MTIKKMFVGYDPTTYQFLGFYQEGRKDMPLYNAEVNLKTYMEDIGNNNKYNPRTGIFYTDQSEIDAKAEVVMLRKRNSLLTQSDKYMLSDFPITGTQKIEMRQFRQELRDFSETGVMPNEPVFFKG